MGQTEIFKSGKLLSIKTTSHNLFKRFTASDELVEIVAALLSKQCELFLG